MNFIRSICAALVADIALVGCGGGGDTTTITNNYGGAGPIEQPPTSPPSITPPIIPIPVPPVAPDVTFSQLGRTETMTPGETGLITRIKVDCPVDQNGYCKKGVYAGQLRLTNTLDWQNVVVKKDGFDVSSWFSKSGNDYRVASPGSIYVYQPGFVDVMGTLSPWAVSGDHSVTLIHVASAEDDKTIVVDSGNPDTITVLALSYVAPVEVTNVSPAQISDPLFTYGKRGNMDFVCPAGVQRCEVNSFTLQMSGVQPNTNVDIYVSGAYWFVAQADQAGNVNWQIDAGHNLWFYQSTTIQVWAVMQTGSIRIDNLKTSSGGMDIAPKIQQNSVSARNCDLMLTDGVCGKV